MRHPSSLFLFFFYLKICGGMTRATTAAKAFFIQFFPVIDIDQLGFSTMNRKKPLRSIFKPCDVVAGSLIRLNQPLLQLKWKKMSAHSLRTATICICTYFFCWLHGRIAIAVLFLYFTTKTKTCPEKCYL